MNLIEQVRDINYKKLNTEGNKKYEIINEIIKDDNCFFNMKIETALSILHDLGYSSSDAKDLYYKLVSLDSYEELNPQYIIQNDTTFHKNNGN